MNKELISIIIPVKNGSNYIREAIDGIKKQNMNLEIIVVNDGSTDNTLDILKDYSCNIINLKKSVGQVKAKNIGLKEAKGNFILFHDHDDIMNENSLNIMYNELTKDDSLQVVFAMLEDFISPELSNEEKKILSPREKPYYGLLTAAILMKKNIFEKVGNFDENLETGEGVDFLMKIEEHNIKTKKIDLISGRRRLHNTNMGRYLKEQENKDYSSILRNRLLKNKV